MHGVQTITGANVYQRNAWVRNGDDRCSNLLDKPQARAGTRARRALLPEVTQVLIWTYLEAVGANMRLNLPARR